MLEKFEQNTIKNATEIFGGLDATRPTNKPAKPPKGI